MQIKLKKLFLTSSFADVAILFPDFTDEELKGKKVTFIPTASIHEEINFYVEAGKKALENLGLIIHELEISKASSNEISQKLQNNDYIYITGGNTFFLLQELKRTGADKIIIEQVNSGKIYIGESAGSVVFSPNIEYIKEIDDPNNASTLQDYNSLSLINFYPLPHYTNFPFKDGVEKIINDYESKLKLIPFTNSQVILVVGDKFEINEVAKN